MTSVDGNEYHYSPVKSGSNKKETNLIKWNTYTNETQQIFGEIFAYLHICIPVDPLAGLFFLTGWLIHHNGWLAANYK